VVETDVKSEMGEMEEMVESLQFLVLVFWSLSEFCKISFYNRSDSDEILPFVTQFLKST